MTNMKKELAKLTNEALEKTNLSNQEILDELDISRTTLYKWRQGTTLPAYNNLEKLLEMASLKIRVKSYEDRDASKLSRKRSKINKLMKEEISSEGMPPINRTIDEYGVTSIDFDESLFTTDIQKAYLKQEIGRR